MKPLPTLQFETKTFMKNYLNIKTWINLVTFGSTPKEQDKFDLFTL